MILNSVKYILLFYNSVSQYDISINVSVLNGIWCADSGEDWQCGLIRTPYTYIVINGLEEHFGSLHRPSDDGSCSSRLNHLCWPFRLHGPIAENTTISNLDVIHFSYIVLLCSKNLMYTCQAIYSTAILHYTLVWTEMWHRKFIIIIGIQPFLAGLGRDQNSVRRLVWLWYAASS